MLSIRQNLFAAVLKEAPMTLMAALNPAACPVNSLRMTVAMHRAAPYGLGEALFAITPEKRIS